MTDYAEGGYIPDGTSAMVITKPLMSLASYRALAPDMRAKLDVEVVITAAEAREIGRELLEKLKELPPDQL